MAESFHCFTCQKVFVALTTEHKTCPGCGGTNGETLSPQRVREGHETGVFHNIDPKTGRPAKRKR